MSEPSPMDKYAFADIGAVARAELKDQLYLDDIDSHVGSLLGNVVVYKYLGGTSRPLSAFLYHLFSTLCNHSHSTLGEEYAQILAVSVRRGTLLSVPERLLRALAFALGQGYAPVWMETLQGLHRAAFFILGGRYPGWLWRLLRLRYIHWPKRVPQVGRVELAYRLLGLMILLTTGVKAAIQLRERPGRGIEEDGGVCEASEMQCALCLGRRKETTVAVCGHLFCWRCMIEWLRVRAQCPLCRHPTSISDLYCIIDPYQ